MRGLRIFFQFLIQETYREIHNMKINGVFECNQKMPIKQLNISQSFYCSFASSNEINFYLNSKSKQTLNPLFPLRLLKNCSLPSEHLLLWIKWSWCGFTRDTASFQWPCARTYRQAPLRRRHKASGYWEPLASKHHVRSLYCNSNTAPQLTASYNKWSNNVS